MVPMSAAGLRPVERAAPSGLSDHALEGAPFAPERILLRVEEVAVSLGIGRTQAYELVHSGEIPSIRIGRLVRVSIEDLREWVKAQPRESSR